MDKTVFSAAVLTVSDRSARGERPDESGPAAAAMLAAAGYQVASQPVVPDERGESEAALAALAEAGTALVPNFSKKLFPCINSMSSIQSMLPVNIVLTVKESSFTSTHPRDTSISRFRETVTACPFSACITFLSPASILSIFAFSPLGRTVISSPICILPASIWP